MTDIAPDTRLTDTPTKMVGANLPSPLSERLDALVDLANAEGAKTNRTEVLAVLLLHAPEKGGILLDEVLAYRRAAASQAAISAVPERNVLRFARHPRGPRPRSQRSA